MGWSVTELRERLERRRRLLAEFGNDRDLKRILQEDIADIERELDRRLRLDGQPARSAKSAN